MIGMGAKEVVELLRERDALRAELEKANAYGAARYNELTAMAEQVGALEEKLEELEDQLAKRDAECATMREALERARYWFPNPREVDHTLDSDSDRKKRREDYDLVDKALSSADGSALLKRLDAAERVVEAARGVGMNWKTGAPYGGDALDQALAEYDAGER